MDERNKTYIADDEMPLGLSLDEILAEYASEGPEYRAVKKTRDEKNDTVVFQTPEQNVTGLSYSSIEDVFHPQTQDAPTPPGSGSAHIQSSPASAASGAHAAPDKPEIREVGIADTGKDEDYASEDYKGPLPDRPEKARRSIDPEKLRERFLAPLLSLMALITVKTGQFRHAGDAAAAQEDEEDSGPEMEPEKASKYYGAQMMDLLRRGQLASGLSAVMVYITLAWYTPLPLTGALRDNIRTVSLLLMLFQMTVMLCALDMLSAGLMSIIRKKPGYNGLTALASLFTLLDAAVLAALDKPDWGLPFCAISALSVTFMLWGGYFASKGNRFAFRLLAMHRDCGAVTAETGLTGPEPILTRSGRSARGFIRRCEEADLSEVLYALLSPALFLLALLLGLAAALAGGQAGAVLHCIAVMLAVACPFSAALCFSLPFSCASGRLQDNGAALSGWSGVSDVGRCSRVVVTDTDLFPQGSVSLGQIRTIENVPADPVVGYTASVVAASGCALARPFTEEVSQKKIALYRVENFAPHEGGGMTAMINGDRVYVGGAGFMNLMHVRVPQKLADKKNHYLYSAINGTLVGIFAINYTAVESVRSSLTAMLASKRFSPLFATRDYNITPSMLQNKFHLPTKDFDFPSFAERFRISGAEPDENSRPAAILTREDITPLAEAVSLGRRLYNSTRIVAMLSAAASLVGILWIFFRCRAGNFDSAMPVYALLLMLLCALPCYIIGWIFKRY